MKITITLPDNWLLAVATMEGCYGGCSCEYRFAQAFGTSPSEARTAMKVYREVRRAVEQETQP